MHVVHWSLTGSLVDLVARVLMGARVSLGGEHATLGQCAADRIAAFGGSWVLFILLNLVLSCVAAAQAPVIQMSQNRQFEKDRLHAQLDYEVNLKAEVEILPLHDKLDELRNHE